MRTRNTFRDKIFSNENDTKKTFIIEDLIQVLFYQIKNRFSACTFLSTSLVLWYSYMNNTEYGVSRGSKIHIFCEVILLLVSREKRRGLLVRWYSDWRKRERNVSGRDIDCKFPPLTASVDLHRRFEFAELSVAWIISMTRVLQVHIYFEHISTCSRRQALSLKTHWRATAPRTWRAGGTD